MGLIFEGHILAYNPNTNKAEWVSVCSTMSDLSHAEEVSTLALCNLVLHIPDKGDKRLDWFREHRNAEGSVEASSTEVSYEERIENESTLEDDGEDADD